MASCNATVTIVDALLASNYWSFHFYLLTLEAVSPIVYIFVRLGIDAVYSVLLQGFRYRPQTSVWTVISTKTDLASRRHPRFLYGQKQSLKSDMGDIQLRT